MSTVKELKVVIDDSITADPAVAKNVRSAMEFFEVEIEQAFDHSTHVDREIHWARDTVSDPDTVAVSYREQDEYGNRRWNAALSLSRLADDWHRRYFLLVLIRKVVLARSKQIGARVEQMIQQLEREEETHGESVGT